MVFILKFAPSVLFENNTWHRYYRAILIVLHIDIYLNFQTMQYLVQREIIGFLSWLISQIFDSEILK